MPLPLIPVTVLTGFFGSGKTTVRNRAAPPALAQQRRRAVHATWTWPIRSSDEHDLNRYDHHITAFCLILD